MPVAEALHNLKYLDIIEIAQHLKNVEYIIMAAPSPDHFKKNPIHFTIFLNTSDDIPSDIKEAIFNKFLADNGIKDPIEVLYQIMPVGFSQSTQDTPMPLLLIKPEDMKNIPNTKMLVMDFLADSDNFSEAKINNLTGWSYSYSE